MPFTPYHAGLFISVKAALQDRFSLATFALAQVLIDIQPLVVMIRGEGHLHGITHTFVIALPIGLAAGLAGKLFFSIFFRAWNFLLRLKSGNMFHFLTPITWRVAFGSALLGTFSHIPLDAIMHSDVEPFYPLATANPLYQIISTSSLYLICEAASLLGFIAYFIIKSRPPLEPALCRQED